MKKFIKKILIFSVLFLSFSSLFAAEGIVTYVSGKVEVQKDNKWVQLKIGDKLLKSDMVSTGFQSEAKIKLMDSVLYLGPLTRVSLEELSSSGQQDKVNVYLKTGSVRSQVNHTENKRVSYQVHTAVAVASVRGTGFSFDSDDTIDCYEGSVASALIRSLDGVAMDNMLNSLAVPDDGYIINANQSLKLDNNGTGTAPVNKFIQNLSEIISSVTTAAASETVSTSNSNTTVTSGVQTSDITDKAVIAGNVAVGFDINGDIVVDFNSAGAISIDFAE